MGGENKEEGELEGEMELVDGEEEEKAKEELEKKKEEPEPYMTKEFYMPGYVDKTPPKLYPPHIRMFKDYIATIGDFKKHSYEKEDFSPDTSEFGPDKEGMKPDTGDLGPDSSGFAPNTADLAPSGVDYKPDYDKFDYSVEAENYRSQSYKPDAEEYATFRADIKSFRPEP